MTPTKADLIVSPQGAARFQGERFPVSLGKKGVTKDKREGDLKTLQGVFRLEHVYYRPDRLTPPRTPLPKSPIRCWDGWSDDPSDSAYNQEVRLPSRYSAERLRRADPLYDLIIVMSANREPIVPGAGSALFIHVWRAPGFPTAGCIAMTRSRLLWLIRLWTDHSRVVIL